MSQQTVTINGTIYDAHTGMPIENVGSVAEVAPAPAVVRTATKPKAAHMVHNTTQKSKTLNRAVVGKTNPHQAVSDIRRPIKKSPAISKFAPHPGTAKPQPRRIVSDFGPVAHPIASKANQHMTQRATIRPVQTTNLVPKPSQIIKQEAISEALANAPSHTRSHEQHKTKPRRSRLVSIASASLALVLLGGYFTYLNMPSLSVRVAAAQAGVNASYPEYRPDGYSLNGPVAYDDGQVSMKFASNGGPQNFSITQTKSAWDSSALEENYVNEASNGGYVPYVENGLKIYVFDNNAAWVNGGVLYKITGDAPLSNDQIRRIATSM